MSYLGLLRAELACRRAGWILTLALVAAAPVAPAVITVEGGCTLVDAIHAANDDRPVGGCPAGSGADEIVLTGDVFLTEADHTDGCCGPTGLPNIASDVAIQGGGFRVARVVGSPQFRILRVLGDASLTLDQVVIANGSVEGTDGAGVFVDGGSLSMIDGVVVGNAAFNLGFGAGIGLDGGDALVVNTLITDNSSGRFGAGIHNRRGRVILSNSSVSGNSSGLRNYGFSAVLTLIESNVANNTEGGIENYKGELNVSHSVVSGHTGASAEAIANWQLGEMTLLNSTLSGNTVALHNGGAYIYASAYIVNSTITANEIGINNVCAGWCDPADSVAKLRNSVVAGNRDGNCFDFGEYIDLGGNLDDDGSCPNATEMTGLDPVLADNGGPTRTHALLEGSSAIDVAGDCGLVFDQRGFPRGVDACDSGSFELGAVAVFPQLEISGLCPGVLTFHVTGATPNGSIAMVTGSDVGVTAIPGGPCESVEIGLDDAQLVAGFVAQEDGTKLVEQTLSRSVCGDPLQAVDMSTCTVGNVATLPR